MTIHPFRGAGFGGSSSPHSQEDNMFSTDVVEVLLGISEGPIKGLKDGAKSFYAGDTPLRAETGENNIGLYDLTHLRGSVTGEPIVSKLGGFGSSTTVNAPELAPLVPVVRQGSYTKIDYLDLRIVINRLGKETDKGSYEGTGQVKLEYRKIGAADWKPVRNLAHKPEDEDQDDGANKERHQQVSKKPKSSPSPDDRVTYWQSGTPPTTVEDAIWFDSDNGNKPMKISEGSWVAYPGASSSGGVWTWTAKSTWGNDNTYKAYAQAKKPKNAKQGDYWLRPPDDPDDEDDGSIHEPIGICFMFNGNSWNIAAGSLEPGGFGTGGETTVLDDGVIQFEGRISSPEVKEFRIPVDNYDGLYEMRVTRMTEADDSEHFFSVTWESFQEVTAKTWQFEALATTQLVVGASDQFSSIPDFYGIYQGRIVKVPSNYDPVSRTYGEGIWDGTWKNAYTDNPAYIGKDLVDNDRYGINAYYPLTIRDMDVYAAGQWCDNVTADGSPRFTFNGLISDPRGGRETVNYVFGLFGGRFFDDGNGFGVIKLDDDSAATMLFTPENVEDGVFVYSFTDVNSRANDYTVTFTNPDLNWETDRRRVYDQDHIDQYGRIPANFEAIGCTSEAEAVRRAKYKLITSTTEVMTVSFKTNRMGLYAEPYQIILIADEDIQAGLSGRILDLPTRDHIVLRDAIYLEPGFNYTVAVQHVNDIGQYAMVKVDIQNNLSGSVMELPLQSNLPDDLPDYAVFSIERRDGTAAPKAFRIISIGESEGDPDKVEIQAIEVNRNKWLYVDGYLHSPAAVDKVNLGLRALPKPVEKLHCKAEARKHGRGWLYEVVLDWTRSPSKKVVKYHIYASSNDGPMVRIGETKARRFELHNVRQGDYLFAVTAVGVDTMESEPHYIEHRLTGDFTEFDEIENLRLIDNIGGENQFQDRSPVIGWDDLLSPRHDKYVVKILDNDTGEVLRTERIEPHKYRYHFDDNKTDHGGTPARHIKFSVQSLSDSKELGDPTYLVIHNPAPAALTNVKVEDTVAGAFITFDEVTKRDYQGVVVHASTMDGFTPTIENEVFRGRQNNIRIKLDKHQTWYIRLAAFDAFGTSDLNYTPQFAVNTDVTAGDPDPGTVNGSANVMFSNKCIISKVNAKNWSGNAVGNKYTEEVVLQNTVLKVHNTRARPVAIDLTLGIKNLLDGSSSPHDPKTFVDSQLYFETQKNGDTSWMQLAKVRAMSVVKGAKDIENSSITRKFDLTHHISTDDAGDWRYRARLVTAHRNGDSGNLSAADVYVTVIANLVWSKN